MRKTLYSDKGLRNAVKVLLLTPDRWEAGGLARKTRTVMGSQSQNVSVHPQESMKVPVLPQVLVGNRQQGQPKGCGHLCSSPLAGHTAVGMGAGDWEAAVVWFKPSAKHSGRDGGAGSVWGRAGNYFVG